MTYNPKLAKIKVDPHAKIQGQRCGLNRRVPTDKRMDGRYQTYYGPCYAVDNYYQQVEAKVSENVLACGPVVDVVVAAILYYIYYFSCVLECNRSTTSDSISAFCPKLTY